MICLDTCFLIDLLRNDKGAAEWSRRVEGTEELVTTAINDFEVVCGIELVRESASNKAVMREKYEAMMTRLDVLPLESNSAARAARVVAEWNKNGVPGDTEDALIAGIALIHGCDAIVTRNKRHFEHVNGLRVETY